MASTLNHRRLTSMGTHVGPTITSSLFTDPKERIKVLLEDLIVPFDPSLVKWRVTETQRIHGRLHGYALPYADPRAYKGRLNLLLTPVGWTDRYSSTTTSTKVLVTCELNIQILGFHSATGEEWSRNEHAATAAEAQAFKRACACFDTVQDDFSSPKNAPFVLKTHAVQCAQAWERQMRSDCSP